MGGQQVEPWTRKWRGHLWGSSSIQLAVKTRLTDDELSIPGGASHEDIVRAEPQKKPFTGSGSWPIQLS